MMHVIDVVLDSFSNLFRSYQLFTSREIAAMHNIIRAGEYNTSLTVPAENRQQHIIQRIL